MSQVLETATETFFDRRRQGADVLPPTRERRQFTNSHEELSPDAAELAQAIDAYKVRHRRRFITYEEILAVVQSLGYHR
jgi:septal ring factor EnvC (AmiA/AmiB activator)